jgi:DNA-binding transcriptional MocR family regulator
MWRPRLIEGARMKYLGIVEALASDIRSARVSRGERLPPQRAIAEALDVDLTTGTRAFNEARRRGLVEAQAGRGTFISDKLDGNEPAVQAHPLIDLSMNIPPQPAKADFRKIFPQGIAGILAADPHGHHLWLRLPGHWRAGDFAEHADRVGVSIVPSSAFAVATRPIEAVRISLGVAPDRGALEDGLTQLASLMAQPSLATRAVV